VTNKLSQSKLRAFYAAVGRFVLTWAEVETYLDILVLQLNRGAQRAVPHQLIGKIKFVRNALEPNREEPHAAAALNLVAEIERLSSTRHDFIHGSRLGHSVKRSVLSFKLGRLLQPPDKPRRRPVTVTADEVEKTTDQLYELGGKMLDVLEALVTPAH
jgi:hypothetical protein